MNTLNKRNTPDVPIRVFLSCASPLTLASLVVDIESSGKCADQLEMTLGRMAREQLIALVGEADARRLIVDAAGVQS